MQLIDLTNSGAQSDNKRRVLVKLLIRSRPYNHPTRYKFHCIIYEFAIIYDGFDVPAKILTAMKHPLKIFLDTRRYEKQEAAVIPGIDNHSNSAKDPFNILVLRELGIRILEVLSRLVAGNDEKGATNTALNKFVDKAVSIAQLWTGSYILFLLGIGPVDQ